MKPSMCRMMRDTVNSTIRAAHRLKPRRKKETTNTAPEEGEGRGGEGRGGEGRGGEGRGRLVLGEQVRQPIHNHSKNSTSDAYACLSV